MEELLFVLSTW